MLPDGFTWVQSYGNNWLMVGDLHVACYSERVPKDGWVIFAYRYRNNIVSARAPSQAACIRWLTRWATVNEQLLRAAKKEPFGSAKPTRDDKAYHKKKR